MNSSRIHFIYLRQGKTSELPPLELPSTVRRLEGLCPWPTRRLPCCPLEPGLATAFLPLGPIPRKDGLESSWAQVPKARHSIYCEQQFRNLRIDFRDRPLELPCLPGLQGLPPVACRVNPAKGRERLRAESSVPLVGCALPDCRQCDARHGHATKIPTRPGQRAHLRELGRTNARDDCIRGTAAPQIGQRYLPVPSWQTPNRITVVSKFARAHKSDLVDAFRIGALSKWLCKS